MIRVSIVYCNTPGGRFDLTYYLDKHVPLVKSRLERFGLRRVEVDKPISGVAGTPPPFACAMHLYFETIQDVQRGLQTHGAELLADVPSYTSLQPQIQLSEMLEL